MKKVKKKNEGIISENGVIKDKWEGEEERIKALDKNRKRVKKMKEWKGKME